MSALNRLRKGAKAWRRAPELALCVRTFSNWPDVVAGYLAGRARYPFTARFRNGDVIDVETFHDLATVWVIFLRHEYSVDPQATSIVDAGANIGAFTLYAARTAPQAHIHAIEPFPTTRERLLKTVRDNGLERRVTVHARGLAGESADRYMQTIGPTQSRGTLAAPCDDSSIVVSGISLDEFVATTSLSLGTVLKLDIEGAEHEVIPAVSAEALRRFARVSLEYHPNGSQSRLFAALEERGFRCVTDRRDFPDSGVASFEQI